MIYIPNNTRKIKYKTRFGEKIFICIAKEAMLYYSPLYKGNVCDVVVSKRTFGLKSDELMRLKIKPENYAFQTECGFYEKDIIAFVDTNRQKHIGEVVFTTLDDWHVRDTYGELYTKEDIRYYRVIDTTLNDKKLEDFAAALRQRKAV